MKITLFLLLTFFWSTYVLASPPPCSKWEFIVRSHEVQAYEKKDGTKVSETVKRDYCKNKFPKVESWQGRFTDGEIKDWPTKSEKFKNWTQLEKELVLKYLSEQPAIFKNLSGITFLRGLTSIYKGNPGAAVKDLNAIALYDEFFVSNNKSKILSHEISHIYVHQLKQDDLLQLVHLMGWRQNSQTKKFLRLDTTPLLRSTSKDLSEDIANNFEFFLHHKQSLQVKNKEVFDHILKVMGNDFKLEQ